MADKKSSIGVGPIIIRGSEGNIETLLIKRRGIGTFEYMWSNPGGNTEDYESLEEAVVRETGEELGVDIEILESLGFYEDFVPGSRDAIYFGYLAKITKDYLDKKKYIDYLTYLKFTNRIE